MARILLVDDDHETRNVLAQLLRLEGYAVDSCVDASDALVRLRSQSYDILLTDYVMPGMTGLALAHTARETRTSLRCIVISGLRAPVGEELGAVHWYSKPIDFDELLRLLRS